MMILGEAQPGTLRALQGSTILLVDDDPATLIALSELLAQHGCRVLTASNGAAGLEHTRQNRPDLIVLGLEAPDGDQGAFYRRLGADPATCPLPLLVLTTAPPAEPIDQQAGGMVDYLSRPFRIEEVCFRIAALLHTGKLVGGLREQHQALCLANQALTAQAAEQAAALAQANARLQEQMRERQCVEERLREYVRRVVDAQEAERDHIARELHDEIGHALALIKMNVRAIQRLTHEDDPASRVKQSLTMIEETLQRVRTMALDLRPSMLDDLGLVTTLRWYVERHAEWAELDAEVSAESFETRIPQHLETVCFRVAQEALSNVARHAQAHVVRINLWQREGAVHMLIQDDGIGFDVLKAQERAAHESGIGLMAMEDRVMLAGGQLVIESSPGRGTKVWVRLPLVKGSVA